MDGKLCSSGEGGTDGKDLPVCMCGSAHDCGAWSMAIVLYGSWEISSARSTFINTIPLFPSS